MNTLLEIINFLSDKNGKIASSRCNEQYFTRQNKSGLYEWLMKETKQLPLDYSISFRVLLLKEGIKELPVCRNCKVGFSRVIKGDKTYQFSPTCSTKCAGKDPVNSKKKSDGRIGMDYTNANARREQTMLGTYGVSFSSQRPETRLAISVAQTNRYQSSNPEGFAKLADKDWLENEYVSKGRHSVDIAEELGVDYDTVLSRCREYGFTIRQYSNRSYLEKQVEDYITSLGFEVEIGNRTILDNGKELDILVKSKNFAIEFDGIYYHSFGDSESERLGKNNHKDKTILANQNGISLIHIFENEWVNRKEIVQGIIRSRLGLNQKIYAKQCVATKITKEECAEFLNKNHIQQSAGGSAFYGLKYKNELVQVLSLGKPRMNHNYDWELIRSCSKLGMSVVEGASTLFELFRIEHTGSVICYSDLRYGEGNVYKHLGFTRQEDTVLGYSWVKGNNVYSRWSVNTKEKRSTLLGEKFDENMSESVNMYFANYRKLFDCGNAVWTLF